MTATVLYCNVTNSSGIISAVITTNHDSPVANMNVECRTSSLTLGDIVTVDMGYVGNHDVKFTGYVKQIEKKVPDNTYIITAADALIRAQDYFLVASDPAHPQSYKNIKAETLVGNLLAFPGLTNYEGEDTAFTFGVSRAFEINLVFIYEYTHMIVDALTYAMWADQDGKVWMQNRKPYVMVNQFPENAQPGWTADTNQTGYTLTDEKAVEISYGKDERYLRNRVVVYGNEGIQATATRTANSLPVGFVKSAVISLPSMIDNTPLAQSIADYNVDLLCRITETIQATVIGDPVLEARKCLVVDSDQVPQNGLWYIFGCDHNLSNAGYTTSLTLKRMVRDD